MSRRGTEQAHWQPVTATRAPPVPSDRIPSHLKLHVEPNAVEERAALADFPGLSALCRTFERITGWSLRYGTGCSPPTGWSREIPADGSGAPPGWLAIDGRRGDPAGPIRPPSRQDVQQHAEVIAQLLAELLRTRQALWQREAELAAGVPVVPHSDERVHLAARLEKVLQGGAEAVGCQAAALYLLDDATRQLKLRASWGLPKQRYLEPARPLQGAMADLEALLGHAVVLEDTSLLPHWKAPEDLASAVCVPVSSPTMLLGTLWMFADQVRDFSAQQTNLVEIIAGRVAADLEREMLLQASSRREGFDRELDRAARWQQLRLPKVAPPCEGWQLAGWASPADCLGSSFYDGYVLPDGRLAAMVGQAHGGSLDGALQAAVLHAAVKSHSSYRHSAQQLLQRVNDTLWSSSAGDQSASLLYALLDPEQGALELAGAGTVGAVLLRAADCEVVTPRAPPLGVEPEGQYGRYRHALRRGDALIVLNEGVRQAIHRRGRALGEQAVAAAVAGRHGSTAQQLADYVRALIDTYNSVRPALDRAVLVVCKR